MKNLESAGVRIGALLVLTLVSILFLYRADELPLAHGDERSFLDVPYRFATFGDLRYPVFISDSFGAPNLRPYPPITALALRSAVLRLVGFSARSSRYVSAALIAVVLIAAGRWLLSRFGVSGAVAFLMLVPAAVTPAVLIAARSTRLEQETLFFGALSALLLAGGGKRGLTSDGVRLALSGAFAAIAAGMHPFGAVYGLAGIALVATRDARGLMAWLAGGAVGAVPTVWWIVSMGRNFLSFTAAVSVKYRAREEDLVAWLSTFPSASWLKPLGLPDRVIARVASVQHGAFSDYVGFPVGPGDFSLLLRFFFWGQVFFIVRFLVRHVRAGRSRNDGVAWLSFLAIAFLVFTFSYVPNTTYGLYGAFHVQLAYAAVCLAELETKAARWVPRVVTPVAVFVAFGLVSAQRLVSEPPVPTLDRELRAVADMARASGIRSEDTVMTSTETWIAAGAQNTSLFEALHYGRGGSRLDAVVYRRSYADFYLNAGLPQDAESRMKVLAGRNAALSQVLVGLRLAGLLILDESDGIYFFRRGAGSSLAVASLDPSRTLPIQIVGTESPVAGPRVECDTRPLPTCAFHER